MKEFKKGQLVEMKLVHEWHTCTFHSYSPQSKGPGEYRYCTLKDLNGVLIPTRVKFVRAVHLFRSGQMIEFKMNSSKWYPGIFVRYSDGPADNRCLVEDEAGLELYRPLHCVKPMQHSSLSDDNPNKAFRRNNR